MTVSRRFQGRWGAFRSRGWVGGMAPKPLLGLLEPLVPWRHGAVLEAGLNRYWPCITKQPTKSAQLGREHERVLTLNNLG